MSTAEQNTTRSLPKKTLDEWLDEVSYGELNSTSYIPSDFALTFMNFIKLVNGEQGESHKTPPVHLKMLDKVAEQESDYIANLVFRGAAKTTIFMEYLVLFVALFGALPGLGDVTGMIYVSDSMDNGVKSARKNIEFRYQNSEFLQEWIPHAVFTDNYLEFQNKDGHRLGCKMFGAKTGLRGTKIFGKRPVLCVLDDLVSDDDSKSKAAMLAIKDTVYKGVNHALDPTRRKVIFNGTPFNTEDILIEAVESGAWDVNVWPVCERFPCEREEFSGAWEDRFTYDYVKAQYEMAVKTGKVNAFMQELMLRITSEEERLIQDSEIQWYSRQRLMQVYSTYNFYITTDFATSAKQTADFSAISVWAYSSNGDWLWVDGILERQTMDKNINDLFRLVQFYKPQQVGIEVSGQQGAFIQWLQNEMIARNVWFNFASSEKSNAPGIRPERDKLTRLNLVVPWFKAGKVFFPLEMKDSVIMGNAMSQIRLATQSGLKGKDDFLDTISMLGYLKPWKPSETNPVTSQEMDVWDDMGVDQEQSGLSSYIV
ncbi:MAG: putative terminase large subunit [Prokaryotic dsDNA virus sp.]|jgi:predicted phage terminase large subunit-like protein|nr:MAG: putative terminase large subunit [Prokaryotic dsDNA virus sp.]|tara:strand:+ start:41126 stop:42745 length:1620 start_codon:yes stop_codon:yes gene_type:complete